MVAFDQVCKGIVTYIHKDLAPLTPKPVRYGLIAFAQTVVEAKMKKFIASGVFDGTPLIDGNMIDIDGVVAMYKAASTDGWPMEMYGFTFRESDLDKVLHYIQEVR